MGGRARGGGLNPKALRAALTLGGALILVTGAGYAFVSLWEGTQSAGARFSEVRWGWMAAAVLVWTLALYCQGARWRALLAAEPSPGAGALAIVLGGTNVIHLAMPGPVAELAAAMFVERRYGIPMAMGIASALLTRLLALGVLGMVTLALWAPVSERMPAEAASWIGLTTLTLGIAGVLVGAACRQPAAVARVVGRAARMLGRRFAARVEGRAAWWAECFARVGRLGPGRWMLAAGWSLANIGVLSLGSWLGYRAVGVTADATGVVFMHALLSVANVAMVLTPGGIGAVDALGVLVFPAVLGGDTGDAALCTLVLRWIQLLSMAFGLPVMAWMLRGEGGVGTLPGSGG